MRWFVGCVLTLLIVGVSWAGNYGGYSYRSYGSYGYSYPSYSYSYRPYYGYSYPSYGSNYSYVPDREVHPLEQGYAYYPEHTEKGFRFSAGYYKNIQGRWHRYGFGFDGGVPAIIPQDTLQTPVRPVEPLRSMPGAEPSREELLRLKIMLDMLERIKKE